VRIVTTTKTHKCLNIYTLCQHKISTEMMGMRPSHFILFFYFFCTDKRCIFLSLGVFFYILISVYCAYGCGGHYFAYEVRTDYTLGLYRCYFLFSPCVCPFFSFLVLIPINTQFRGCFLIHLLWMIYSYVYICVFVVIHLISFYFYSYYFCHPLLLQHFYFCLWSLHIISNMRTTDFLIYQEINK